MTDLMRDFKIHMILSVYDDPASILAEKYGSLRPPPPPPAPAKRKRKNLPLSQHH